MSTAQSAEWTSLESEAVAVVEDFLAHMGAGRLDAAQQHLAPDVSMVFPGARRYTNLTDLADASRARYRSVDKVREHYDAMSGPDGEVVVSTGTLFGENLHGVRYANVRYVDRFVVRDGLIRTQQVWNDLAQSGVLDATDESQIAEQWRATGSAGHGAAAADESQIAEQWRATGSAGHGAAAADPAAHGAAAHVRRSATAEWTGRLRGGNGSLVLRSGASEPLDFSLESRKADAAPSTSPEELLAAAHASCFAMALRGALDRDGGEHADGAVTEPHAVTVDATCTLRIDDTGWRIQGLDLRVAAPGVTPERLRTAVAIAEQKCAISLLVQGNAEVSVMIADSVR